MLEVDIRISLAKTEDKRFDVLSPPAKADNKKSKSLIDYSLQRQRINGLVDYPLQRLRMKDLMDYPLQRLRIKKVDRIDFSKG